MAAEKEWSPDSSRIKFQLLGTPQLTLATGQNKEGQTMWFDVKKAKKHEIPEQFIVKDAGGKPIDGGRIRWAGTRVITFNAKTQREIIDALYYSPYCQNGPYASRAVASFVMIDDEKDKRDKYKKLAESKKAIERFINTTQSDMKDIAVVLGFDDTDVELYEPNVKDFVDRKPDTFMNFFTLNKSGETVLKENYRIEALVRRAQRHKVLEVNKGAYYLAGELLGADLQATVLNLMNSTEGSPTAKANAVPLIMDHLKKKKVIK